MIDQAGNPEPDEPGEIGWPALAKEPHDPSVPKRGSGGAKAEVPEVTVPTVAKEEPIDAGFTPPSPEPIAEVVEEEPKKKSRR